MPNPGDVEFLQLIGTMLYVKGWGHTTSTVTTTYKVIDPYPPGKPYAWQQISQNVVNDINPFPIPNTVEYEGNTCDKIGNQHIEGDSSLHIITEPRPDANDMEVDDEWIEIKVADYDWWYLYRGTLVYPWVENPTPANNAEQVQRITANLTWEVIGG